jgi:tRNA threonylcarbamoyladenosine biosynthesis protein TsaB
VRVLGIDTAIPAAGVALIRGGDAVEDDLEVLAEISGDPDQRHAETLLGAVDGCLQRAGCSLEDVDGLAVSVGPGSFTGLRVGLATAKGLAFATGAWLVGVPTLDAFARAFVRGRGDVARAGDLVCVCLDARRGEVYGALFELEGRPSRPLAVRRRLDDAVLRPDELAARVSTVGWRGATLRVVGDGALRYADVILPDLRQQGEIELIASESLPRAVAVADIAIERFRREGAQDGDALVPAYLRASEAERKRQMPSPH